MMGSPDEENGREKDEVLHKVTISQPFLIGVFEVTQGEYERVMGSNPSRFKGGNRFPVETVSWDDAQEFCEKLTIIDHEKGCLPEYAVYSLPTEAQWEYACRAGSTAAYYWGDKWDDDYGWQKSNSGGEITKCTHAVGKKKPNAWGLFDMSGNVWEWCYDWYDKNYYKKCKRSGTVVDPEGPDVGYFCILRGGGWISDEEGCRSASRGIGSEQSSFSFVGFRVVAVRGKK